MATYYADFDLATGNNDGTDAANAWQTMTDAIAGTNGTPPAAGDTVLCTGTDTLVAIPTLAASGGNTTNIIFRGVNGSFVDDGTRAVLDANSAQANCLNSNSKQLFGFENFTFQNATGVGINGGIRYGYMYNCIIQGCGSHGISAGIQSHFTKCQFINNTGYGAVNTTSGTIFNNCVFAGNSGFGFTNNNLTIVIDCLIIDNTGSGFTKSSTERLIVSGCIISGNGTDGIGVSTGYHNLVKNTIISYNGDYGIEASGSGLIVADRIGYIGNVTGNVNNSAFYFDVPSTGSDVTISADPFTAKGSGDYTILSTNTELVSLEKVLDGSNSAFDTIGLPPEYGGGGGGNLIDGSLII